MSIWSRRLANQKKTIVLLNIDLSKVNATGMDKQLGLGVHPPNPRKLKYCSPCELLPASLITACPI